MARRTLEDKRRDRAPAAVRLRGNGRPELVPCPNCGRRCHAFEIVDVNDTPEIPHDDACTQCLTDVQRDQAHEREKAARKKLKGWNTPEAVEAKAHRDRMLEKWRWAVAPDSPLSAACQNAFLAYLKAWHRMTVDAASPAAFKEPILPAMEYAPDPLPAATSTPTTPGNSKRG